MPSSKELLDPGIEPMSLMSLALAGGLFTTSAIWKAQELECIPLYLYQEFITSIYLSLLTAVCFSRRSKIFIET